MRKRLVLPILVLFCLCILSSPMTYVYANVKNDCSPITATTDFHMHMVTQKLIDQMKIIIGGDVLTGRVLTEFNAETIISQIDRAGIQKAVILSGAYVWGMGFVEDPVEEYNDVKEENDWTALQATKYPKRLTPAFSLNPLKDYAIEEMDRCFYQLNMPIMKLHFGNSNVNLRDKASLEKIEKVFAHAEALRIPIILHLATPHIKDYGPIDAQIFIDEILAKHPNLRVSIVHLGGQGGYDENVQNTFRVFIDAYKHNKKLKKENVYFDMSGVIITQLIDDLDYIHLTTDEELQRLAQDLKEWGLDHILWSSDFYSFDSDKYLQDTIQKLPLNQNKLSEILNKDPKDFLFR